MANPPMQSVSGRFLQVPFDLTPCRRRASYLAHEYGEARGLFTDRFWTLRKPLERMNRKLACPTTEWYGSQQIGSRAGRLQANLGSARAGSTGQKGREEMRKNYDISGGWKTGLEPATTGATIQCSTN